LLDAENSLFQRESHTDAEVPPMRRLLALLTTKPPHETAKEVSDVKAPERLAGTATLGSPGLACTRESSGAGFAIDIILLSLCRITQRIVCLVDVRHVPGCLGIILVEVRMILLDQFTIGLLDIILRGPPRHSHDVIVVSISRHVDLHSEITA
jgi:hypothetical protein